MKGLTDYLKHCLSVASGIGTRFGEMSPGCTCEFTNCANFVHLKFIFVHRLHQDKLAQQGWPGEHKCITCFSVSQRGPKSVSSQRFSTSFVFHHTMFSDEILAFFVQLQSKTKQKCLLWMNELNLLTDHLQAKDLQARLCFRLCRPQSNF